MNSPRHASREQDDALARDAAQRLVHGAADSIGDARAKAATEAKAGPRGALPSAKRIRQHAQMIDMQAMGQAGYEARRRTWLALAEDLMTTLEQAVPDCQTALVGRAAEGHFDADPCIHIRVRAAEDIGLLSRLLLEYGYDEPEQSFSVVDSRYGRLSQWRWNDSSGLKVILTRCPNSRVFDDPNDLATGKRLARLGLSDLRALVGQQ